MDLGDFDGSVFERDDLDALLQIEEEELLIRESSNSNHAQLDIQIENDGSSLSSSTTEMPFNRSILSQLPASVSDNVQHLISNSGHQADLLAQLLSSSSSSSSSSAPLSNFHGRRNNRRSPPSSIQEYIQRKGNFSVTDLISPLHCEYSLLYSILGQTHLPVKERPQTISTPQGNVIVPNKEKVERKEKVLQAGTAVHEKLEREIASRPVYIKTKTREDNWGLRMLKLIGSIKSLMKSGIAREVPIFGIIHEKLVIGVIDEISVATILPSSKMSSNPSLNKPSAQSPKKTWNSQEAWKKEKEKEKLHGKAKRREKGQKALSFSKPASSISTAIADGTSSTSTLSNRAVSSPSPQKLKPLDGFFSSESSMKSGSDGNKVDKSALSSSGSTDEKMTSATSNADKGKGKAKEDGAQRPLFGFHLSDTKTRVSARLPWPEDQKGARFQCMIYKRLLDGLSSGALLQSNARDRTRAFSVASSIAKAHYPTLDDAATPLGSSIRPGQSSKQPVPKPGWLNIDPKGTPLLSYDLFNMLGLDEERELSESFVNDSKELWERWDVVFGREKEIEVEEEFVEEVVDTEVLRNRASSAKPSNSGMDLDLNEKEEIASTEAPFSAIEGSLSGASQSQSQRPKKPTRIRKEKVLVCTLQDLAKLLDNTLLELSALAEVGMGIDGEPSGTQEWKPRFRGACIQNDLRLVYRLREQRGAFNRRGGFKRQGGRAGTSSPDSTNSKRKRASSQELCVGNLDEETQLAMAIQLSLQQPEPEREKEDSAMTTELFTNTVLQNEGASSNELGSSEDLSVPQSISKSPKEVEAPSSSPRRSQRLLQSSNDLSPIATLTLPSTSAISTLATFSKPVEEEFSFQEDPLLIGVVPFPHNHFSLEAHLIDVLLMWNGERELKGVSEQNVGRCSWCEYLEGCEWRVDKGEAKRQSAEDARLAREMERKKQSRFEDLKDSKENAGLGEDELWKSLDEEDIELDWSAIETNQTL